MSNRDELLDELALVFARAAFDSLVRDMEAGSLAPMNENGPVPDTPSRHHFPTNDSTDQARSPNGADHARLPETRQEIHAALPLR